MQGVGGEGCKQIDLSRQRIVLVARASGMHCMGGVAAAASSAVRVCGRERLGVANNSNKIELWWKREVKDAIQANKVACKAWLHNKPDSSLHSRNAEEGKSTGLW